MLDEMRGILNEHYYDPKFHGMDLKARIQAAKARVKTLQYDWQMYRVMAQVLLELDDSHTFMIPPPRTDHFQYGIGWQMIYDKCFITSVKKDTDAFAQGVQVGDQVLTIRNFPPTRADLWKMEYVIYRLDPLKTLTLKLKKLDGTEETVVLKAKTLTDKEFRAELKANKEREKNKPKDRDETDAYECHDINHDLMACKLYSFDIEPTEVDKMMKRVNKYPKLIVDLRRNGGGYVDTERQFVSYFFDHEVKILDMVSKGKTETRKIKDLSKDKQYKGEVAVLVDSRSASAAEISARVLQIEKRAKVYGDFSSGKVMTSIHVPFVSMVSALVSEAIIRVGMSVTVGDVIMSDGSRLEKTGVVPDEVVVPTGLALSKRYDPVLAYAAAKMGASITEEEAGKYYFLATKPEDDEDLTNAGDD